MRSPFADECSSEAEKHCAAGGRVEHRSGRNSGATLQTSIPSVFPHRRQQTSQTSRSVRILEYTKTISEWLLAKWFRDSTARNHRNHAGPWTGQNRTKNMGVHFAQLKKPKHLRSKVASSSARHNTWGENASSLGTSALFLYYTQSQNIIV